MMMYGHVYVAQISLGAQLNQTVKAIQEAEAYPGPSLIIAYSLAKSMATIWRSATTRCVS
ncbi:pyruvate-flavodoxin oxidoreductase [Klebsiella pneumoniae]|uniref:Pyruvate-flavodoxin oxidoreductase n=1 Tax=Klebsiella pneumoniae TaxID=573 RepID=A0A377TTI8_KLEPN|nr:pyruvate-flavodoxin oxidoreductase [Klebsiella pneumoniae]